MSEMPVTALAARDQPPARVAQFIIWPTTIAALVAAFIAPAIWNGFPLIFPDTGGYLARAFERDLEMGRSALYGLFLAGGIPLDFWPNIVLQSAAVVWLILLTLRTHGLGGRPLLALGIGLVLAIGTGLPWYAGLLIPDILVPAAVLALYLLAFRDRGLHRFEKILLTVFIAAAIASHMSILALSLGLAASLMVLPRVSLLRLTEPRVSLASAAVAAGIALSLLSNFAITGRLAFTPGGESFVFGRLVQDGIVQQYLDDRCPDTPLRLCAYQKELPDSADDWLWANDSPFWKLGGWKGYAAEEQRIIVGSILAYPIVHLTTAAQANFDQFVNFGTEVTVNPWWNAPAIGTLKDLTPGLMPRLMAARQQATPSDLQPFNALHVPVGWLSLAAVVIILAFRNRFGIAPAAAALSVTVLLALLGNAAISGIFSNPVDRYQSRMIWLAPLALAIALLTREKPVPQSR